MCFLTQTLISKKTKTACIPDEKSHSLGIQGEDHADKQNKNVVFFPDDVGF